MKYIICLVFIFCCCSISAQYKFKSTQMVRMPTKHQVKDSSRKYNVNIVFVVNIEENRIYMYFAGIDKPDVFDIIETDPQTESDNKKSDIFSFTALDNNGKKCSLILSFPKDWNEEKAIAICYTDYTYLYKMNNWFISTFIVWQRRN